MGFFTEPGPVNVKNQRQFAPRATVSKAAHEKGGVVRRPFSKLRSRL